MASIYDNIRAALEVKLSNVSGLPEVAWENLSYTPNTGTSFVKPRLVPTVREPAVRGLNPQIYYQGIFRVDCFVPEGLGPATGDALSDDILTSFEATTDIFYNTETEALLTEDGAFLVTESGTRILRDNVINVSIRYSEREQGMPDGAFYMIPVNIGWYIYS
jgi:hypothetical protein